MAKDTQRQLKKCEYSGERKELLLAAFEACLNSEKEGC